MVILALAAACGGGQPQTTMPAPPPGGIEIETTPLVDKTLKPAPVVAAKAKRIRSVEGITEYALDNGLQVLLFPDPTQSTVTVNVTYLVGSRHEGYGETGMAHLLEHMLFKGSKRHGNSMKAFDERGAWTNGSTWTDRTNYYETLPATGDNLEFALDVEADRMVNALILPKDLATEFSVVRNEFEMYENDPEAMLETRVIATAYLWHNYGKDTIGSRADIERVPVPALRAFYEKYYQPDNAVLVVSGKFEEAATLATIERLFGAIPRPARVLTPSYTVEPVQDGERTVTLRRNGDVHFVAVAYHTVGAASPDYPALLAALDVLDREPSGRLYKKLVETQLAASVGAGQYLFRDPYLAMVTAEVRDAKHVDTVEKTIFAELEKLGSTKVDDKEVERWRASAIKELELALADTQQLAIELSEFAALGDWRALFAYRDRIDKVTAADVARVAKTYFKSSNRTSGRFIPTKDADRVPLTETPDIAAVVKGIESGEVKEQGEVFAATFENIEARTRRVQLASGIKAALLPKKTRGGKVELRLNFHWGDEKSLQGKEKIAELTAQLLQRGTANKSYQDIQDLENQLKSQISIRGGAEGFSLHIETLRDKLPAALDLAAELLRSPSFPAKQLELIKQEQLAYHEQQLQDPTAVAWTTIGQLTSKWPKTDPRHPMSSAEQIVEIKRIRIAQIKAFYKEHVGVAAAELSVVGDFQPDAISAQVDKLFGSWKSARPYARLANRPFGVPGAAKSIEIKDKEMTQLVAGHDLAMRDTDPDYPAWLLVGQLLGGDTSSRLWVRLREKEGMSYGAGASTYAGALDDSGGFHAEAIVAPQNLAKARAALVEEITRITASKVTDEELQRAKDGWIKSQDTNLSNDGFVTNMLASQTFRGRTTEFVLALRAKIRAVTVADVERVAKKYLDPSKLVIVDAGDLSKAK
jgi:zinc protease